METVARGDRPSARLMVRSVLSAVILLVFVLAGCTRSAPLTPAGYLQVDISTSPTSLDPRFASDAISSRIDELIYDSMVRVDRHGNFVGELAASIERPSPTELVFHLRHGVRFSDGRPLTARDVVYTYDSVLNPASLSLKRAGLAEMASISAQGKYTVVMKTKRPFAAALEMAMFGIVPDGSPVPGKGAVKNPPGSGPFMLARFSPGAAVILKRNPYAANDPANAPLGIVFKVVPDATVRALELIEGICDFAENDAVQPDLIPYLEQDSKLRVQTSPGTSYEYMAFNFRDPRLRDLRVRRAIAYAIDRKAIVASLLRNTGRVATGMLAPENWAYDGDVKQYHYNPAKARQLLEEAGYRPGSSRLTFVYKTTPENRRLAEALQAMLQNVGITLDIRTNEWGTFYSDLTNGNFDLVSSQWVGIADPHQYYMVFDSKMTPQHGGENRGDYSNPAMDRLLEAGETTLNQDERRKIYGQVQKLAARDLPYVSLWWLDNVAVMNRRVVGFEPYPNGSLLSFSAVSFAPGEAPDHPRD